MSSAFEPARLFTLEQANRMLPLIRRIVEDIVQDYARWREQVGVLEVVAAGRRGDSLPNEAEKVEEDAQRLAADIERYVTELRELGVDFKGFDQGLVDFPAELDGRLVYLCWKLGEDSVEYWHDVDAGYAGRQKLVTGD
ncbi:MAG: DUF2203 domain-containing protein [Gemmatimonadaceae bacterium]|nr:DUF2203 domain-containing protein [Gemmatimonadaceae bacterium]